MTRVRDLFPLLQEIPPVAAERGLSLDSPADELRDAAGDGQALSCLVQGFVAHVVDHEEQRLATVLPGLKAIGAYSVDSSLRMNRSRNALAHAGITTWGQLAERSARDLRLLSNVGALTLGDIVARSIEMCIVGPSPSPLTVTEPPYSDEISLTVKRALRTLRVLAAWAARERGVARLGDLWELHADGGTLPPGLAELWDEFSSINPAELADEEMLGASLGDLVTELLDSLEPSHRTVYKQRVLTSTPRRLEEVGQAMGFTRERARQIQVKAVDRIEAALHTPRFWPILWRATDLRARLGLVAIKDSEETATALEVCLRDVSEPNRETATQLLLRVAGPYRERNGWLEVVGATTLRPQDLALLADEHGLLSIADAYRWLAERGVDAAFQEAWIERSRGFRRLGDYLAVWNGTLVDKCVSVLAFRGQPTDTETLIVEMGEGRSARGARDRFFGDPRLIRVNRSEWALRSWGMEEYTGITDEITQRVAAGGGKAELGQVVADIASQFDVRASSVKAYAEAPMFIVEDGWVRLRHHAEAFVVKGDIASCRGVYAVALDRLSMVLPVDKDTLRGSGRLCPAPFAEALGVSPGHPRAWNWPGGELLITWPRTAAFGPSFGSIRALAQSVGAEDRDTIRLDFDLSAGEVRCVLVPRSLDGLLESEVLKLMTGIEFADTDDLVECVAAALRCPPGVVRRRLVERGDPGVAALLPTQKVDASLEAALSDLAGLLEDLD